MANMYISIYNIVAQDKSQYNRPESMNTHKVTYSHHVDNVMVFDIISHKHVKTYITY